MKISEATTLLTIVMQNG